MGEDGRPSPVGLHRWEWAAVVGILLLAFALRLVALTDVPPGLRYDELLNYRMAERVLAGERPIYFTESWGHEPLFHYVQAAVMAVTRRCVWSLRLPAVFFGVLGLLTTWLVARRLFGARVAALSVAVLAVSFWSVFLSREGSRVIAITPLPCLAIYFLWRGLTRVGGESWRVLVDFSVGGALLGSACYVYVAGRAMCFLPVVFAIYLAVFHPSRFRRAWMGLLTFVVVAAVVAAPLMLQLRQNPAMEQRLDHLAAPWHALKRGDPGPVLHLAIRAAGMFVWRGQKAWLYNVPGRPVFDAVTGICFILGLVICVRRWRQARYALLLLWLGVGLGPAVLVPPAASLTHAIGAQSPAYVLAAIGLGAWMRILHRLTCHLGIMTHKQWKWVTRSLVVGVVALHGVLSGYAYVVVWANAPAVKELYQAGITAVARELDARELAGPVAIGAPYVDHWNPWNTLAFDLTSRRGSTALTTGGSTLSAATLTTGDDLHVRWFNPAAGWVWPATDSTALRQAQDAAFYFPTDPLGPQTFDPVLEALFMSDAVRLLNTGGAPSPDEDASLDEDTSLDEASSSVDFTAFRVAHPGALESRLDKVARTPLTWPPALGHLPAPSPPLAFGERFALLGVELQRTKVAPEEELRLITYWEVVEADSEPVVAFVHLTSDGRDIWGQHDGLDVRPSSLLPGDRFAQVHTVSVRSETPPGTYHLQVGLYHPETLARLPIATGEGLSEDPSPADRVWVGRVDVRE